MRKIIFILILSAIQWSCKTHTTATTNTPHKEIMNTKGIENHFKALIKPSSFQYLKIESKISIENGSFIPPANTTIYIENGQKVWMNITAMFFNVARGIATPQGIKGYEKIGKNYIDSNFEYLNQLLNVNFIDYHSLQNLLVGKVFFPINEKDFSFTASDTGYILSSTNNQKITTNGKNFEYLINMKFSPFLDLMNVSMTEVKTNNLIELHYSDWDIFEEQRLPKNVKIIIKGKKNAQILIENTNFGFSKMETPYSVPKNYTKKEF